MARLLRSTARRPRQGSVTLVAFMALVVLGVLIMALHYTVGSRYKQIHHAYYSEKSMALIEGLNAIARGEAQRQLEKILEAAGDWVKIEGIKEKAQALYLLEEHAVIRPVIKVQARLLMDPAPKYFAKTDHYGTLKEDVPGKDGGKPVKPVFKDGNELEGIVEIRVDLEIQGFEGINFSVPKKSVITQYEFKRLRRVPPFLRHFSLWIKNAVTRPEEPDKFSGGQGNFNYARVPLTGANAGGTGVLFLKNGSSFSEFNLPEVDEGPATDENRSANPFFKNLGYVYLGGDAKADAYLNLTAGDDNQPYTETFQLYRGTTTDFYKVWDIDFTNFMEKARVQQDKGDRPQADKPDKESWLRAAWSWIKDKAKSFVGWLKKAISVLAELDALEYSGKAPKSANLPLYYIVRKDYGYAVEWGKSETYRRFGFTGTAEEGREQTIYCNNLHLYGSPNLDGQNSVCPTLVMGNVYRRYLSLAGYKQRRATENPSASNKFEIQAGPIEYFKKYDDLMKRTQDPTVDASEKAPIWVWDARVDWNRNEQATNGTYLPISGVALFGRVIPGLARLWEDDSTLAQKLFLRSIDPPDELGGGKAEEAAETITRSGGDFEEDVKGGISPLFLALSKGGYFQKEARYDQGQIYADNSPYFEEVTRCFAYASYGALKKMGDQAEAQRQGLDDPEVEKVVKAAAERWQQVIDQTTGGTLKAKSITVPGDFKEAECKGKAAFWQADDRDASAPGANLFPFSLPDPWARGTYGNFEEAFEQNVGDKDDFFKRYFYHLMTNPAMVQPYNNGMRFMFRPLRDMFARSTDDRTKALTEKVIPEIRDGIGFMVEGKNDYLKRDKKDRFNKPINDAVLKAIHKQRQSDDYLKKGYFFMDDYGDAMTTPAEVDLADVFKGRRHVWKMGWDDFKKRFCSEEDGKLIIRLNTVVALTSDLTIDRVTKVIGGGALLLGQGEGNGPITIGGKVDIKADLLCDAPLFIVAKEITIGGDAKDVHASLVALDTVKFGGQEFMTIHGNVCALNWDFQSVIRGGGRYLVSFNSGLKGDESYIQNIEPRIHKFQLLGGDQ